MKYIGTFTTESGNIYLYDGTSNMVLPINKEIASIVENTVELDRNKIREVANTNIKNVIDKWNLFSKPTSMYLSESEIKHAILEYPYPQLILGITEDCNLRCKYCIFSGNYEYMRHHSPKKMTLECAKKAIDYFMQIVSDSKEYTPDQQPIISFYGGEVLLEYEMIKEIVKYVRTLDTKVIFAFTTNGTLLTKEKINFFVEHNFMISISLDGPKDINDKNRVFPNEKGSFEVVYSNILSLKEEIERQNKVTTMPVLILTCYEDTTDMIKLNEFFVKNQNDLRGFNGRVNSIMPIDYGEKPKRNDTMNDLYKEYITTLINHSGDRAQTYFMDRIFGVLFRVLNNRYISPEGNLLSPYFLNSCIPGGKIFVDCEGNFHICERINYNYSIGSVSEGLDIKKICDIVHEWQVEVEKNCAGCPYTTICGICFARCAEDHGFNIKKICKNRRKNIEAQLSSYYSVLEHNPDIIGFCSADQGILEEKYERLTEVIRGC